MRGRTDIEYTHEDYYDNEEDTTERTEHMQRQLDGEYFEIVLEVVQVHTAEMLR